MMHTNSLAQEKSPYLRQHAHNPVDWMPWGEAAFARAREEDKPIFLSIGYSTCHWCHVMAHESFESETVAAVLNRDFVSIKVDREERPDVDRIYMLYVQAVSGSGGWPMSVFLTPQLRPFYGGTYFPPDTRYGRPGFRDLVGHLSDIWKTRRDEVEASGTNVIEQLKGHLATTPSKTMPTQALLDSAFTQLQRNFDAQYGGFGAAPKFPRPAIFIFLLRYYSTSGNEEALDMVTQTLLAMADGGMHDQLGGGFHRYSVDREWFVPHFEKMLYDQAQLLSAYAEAFEITAHPRFEEVARKIISYLLRDLRDPEGAFYSAEDADSAQPDDPSHSGEGAFYIWRQSEIEGLLPAEEARTFCRRFGVEPDGNVREDPHGEFGGRNILHEALPAADRPTIDPASADRLFKVRETRPRPHLDRKILTSWNALAISALAKASVVFKDAAFLNEAKRVLAFLIDHMYQPGPGIVLRRYCEGEAAIEGFADDYAFLAQACLDLFEADFQAEHLHLAAKLAESLSQRFEDSAEGGFYSTNAEASDLLLRMKEEYDGAEPSANSVGADVLLRLAQLTGEERYRQAADRAMQWAAAKLASQPTAAPQMLAAIARWLLAPEQTVIRYGRMDDAVHQAIEASRQPYNPFRLTLAISDELSGQLKETAPFLSSLQRQENAVRYQCRNFTCDLPQSL